MLYIEIPDGMGFDTLDKIKTKNDVDKTENGVDVEAAIPAKYENNQ